MGVGVSKKIKMGFVPWAKTIKLSNFQTSPRSLSGPKLTKTPFAPLRGSKKPIFAPKTMSPHSDSLENLEISRFDDNKLLFYGRHAL